jgi:hypothetical protein
MSTYVPGYGTFDPDLPEWLALHTDGKLYNVNDPRNRLDFVASWIPPEGWRGGEDVRFVPEGEVTTPPLPPTPTPVPATTLVTVAVNPALLTRLLAAMRMVVAHDNELLALAQQRVADDESRMQESLRLSVEAGKAYDAVLADLLSKVNSQ